MTDAVPGGMANEEAAKLLREVADRLAQKEASPYRVGAYRRAAETLEALDEPLELLFQRGTLPSLPGIDRSTLRELAHTGKLRLLDRLRETPDPVALLRTLPGVGPKLARLIHDALHVETLEALRAAADEGRLQAVPGVGPRRALAIRVSLAELLGEPADCAQMFA